MDCEGGKAWEQVVWRICGCLLHASVQGQAECGPEEPDLVEGVLSMEGKLEEDDL